MRSYWKIYLLSVFRDILLILISLTDLSWFIFFQPAFISRGVPHGSILAPLLFLIHTNDMSQTNKCYLFLYADDSGLNFEHKDFNETEKQLN